MGSSIQIRAPDILSALLGMVWMIIRAALVLEVLWLKFLGMMIISLRPEGPYGRLFFWLAIFFVSLLLVCLLALNFLTGDRITPLVYLGVIFFPWVVTLLVAYAIAKISSGHPAGLAVAVMFVIATFWFLPPLLAAGLSGAEFEINNCLALFGHNCLMQIGGGE